MLLLLAGCARTELLQALDERQANEVVAVLLRHNIAAEKHRQGKEGFTVRVAKSDLAEAIDLVQLQGLPSLPRTQIATQFPADAMVSTPLGERARLLSAIEQRLEETLAALGGVQSARVHVSYDAASAEASLQQRRPPSMHIAAVLTHVTGVEEELLAQRVRRLLRNAFVDVSYDDVSVLLTPAEAPRTLAVTPSARAGSGWLGAIAALLAVTALGLLGWIGLRRGAAWSGVLGRRFGRARSSGDGVTEHVSVR